MEIRRYVYATLYVRHILAIFSQRLVVLFFALVSQPLKFRCFLFPMHFHRYTVAGVQGGGSSGSVWPHQCCDM